MDIYQDVKDNIDHLHTRGASDTDKFRYLGAGLYRMAWLHRESGKVIKVGDKGANDLEVQNSERFRNEPSLKTVNGRVPEVTHMFDFGETMYPNSVIMAEYVDGKPSRCAKTWVNSRVPCDCGHSPCSVDVRDKLGMLTSIGDLHADNVLIKDDEYWIVDMGM